MNFLAIDTSGNHLVVAAYKNGERFVGKIENCAMRHATSLMGVVEDTLKKANLALSECDFFAAAVGAGSFTGIRIGISAAKGFALACGKPTLPVTSFDTIAYTAIERKQLAIVDALHGAYYVCGYENGNVVLPPAYVTTEEVRSRAAEGYALRSNAATEGVSPVDVADVADGLINAVIAKAESGAFGELKALYVRKSSAELNLEGAK